MARKSKEELEQLMKKLNTNKLWSFSRINNFVNCPYSYFLKYVKGIKEKESSIYSVLGGEFHNILEDFYNKKITFEEMLPKAENIMFNVELNEMKFNRADEESNQNIRNKYFECIKHFFKYYKPLNVKVVCEPEIIVNVNNNYFLGYIDAVHKVGDNYYITDYKSSTIYTGKKILKEGKQLLLYALGLNQKGIPLENIKIQWNFLKYIDISYTQKNGKDKTMHMERHNWVGGIKTPLRMFLKDSKKYTEDEVEGLLDQCIDLNSFDILPNEIKNKFSFADCYIEIPVSEEIINELKNELIEIIDEIHRREKEYNQNKNEDIWKIKIEDDKSYFCSNICGFTAGQCSCWKTYLENKDLFKNEENRVLKDEGDIWLTDLGLI